MHPLYTSWRTVLQGWGGGGTVAKNFLAFWCTTRNNTPVIPFRVVFQPGVPLYEQVVYAAKKALIGGQLRPGDPFPSVRALSAALKINPNTAHKVHQQLLQEGLIEVRPGIGAVAARPPSSSRAERSQLLDREVEHLVVEAKRLGLAVRDVLDAVESHWTRLEGRNGKR